MVLGFREKDHVPGSANHEADKLSRSFNDDLEWSLNKNIFNKILEKFLKLNTDLFASRLNKKLGRYA